MAIPKHDRFNVFRQPAKRPHGANPMLDPLVITGKLGRGRGRLRPRARDRNEFEPIDVREIRRQFSQTRGQFASMLGILDPGLEETPADMRRMDLIHKELAAFEQELRLRMTKPVGSG